ncbi:MAG: TonB-dependent receptor plug domain-containing protein [Cyclobacteriaceae bacterium]
MKFIYTIAMIALCISVRAQYAETEEQDSVKTSFLNEVVISANKIPEQRREVAQQVMMIRPSVIKSFNAQTTADLLQNTGMVAMQRSQQGGGSPIMRGFEASRVLLVVDGVRMNNAIYRAGHLQNALRVDNNNLDHAEILFGPSSTVYGSDALGGVIHFYTRNPVLAINGEKSKKAGEGFVRLGSVNDEKTFHVDLNLANDRMGSFTSFTISDFGDLRMGKEKNPNLDQPFGLRNQYVQRAPDNSADLLVDNPDPLVQKFSGYRQWDLLQKFLYKASDRTSHTLNFQYSNTTNVPRYDRLTDPGANGVGLNTAEWNYGPEKRFLGSYSLKATDLGKWADGVTATASFQDIEESRITRNFNSNNRDSRVEKISVYGLNIDFNKDIKGHKIRYGFDGQYNVLNSIATRTNITNLSFTSVNTRYPDGDNVMGLYALYITHTKELKQNLYLNDGVRVGYSTLFSSFNSQQFFAFPFKTISQENLYASGNVGLVYTPNSWKFSLMGSTGFRVPNFDDLTKVFDTRTGNATTTGTLVIPNSDLGPEKTINADLSVTRFFGSRARLEATGFYTKFFDAIVVKPSTFNGQSTILYNGFQANVLTSQNAAEAYLYGYTVGGRFDFTDEFSLSGSYNFTYGRVLNPGSTETPLDHIAPAFGRVGILYAKGSLRAEAFVNFSSKKKLEDYSSSGEDNLQYAPADGMPGWYNLNLRGSYEINKMFVLQAGIDNLMDIQYRTFASGINAPGRNIFGTLRVRF